MPRDITRPSTGPRALREALRLAAIAVALAGLYVLFAGSLGLTEALATVACAGLVTLRERRIGARRIPYRVEARTVRPLLGATAALPGRVVRVGIDLMRGSGPGTVRVRPAAELVRHPLSGTGPEALGERAMAVLAASLTPESYVLELDARRAAIVLHALERQPAPERAA